jgi:RNA polymerase sigma factor (sigma-70 family)
MLYEVGTLSGLSDAALLDRFVAGRDAASDLAFEVLVRRHGPMVLRVCRSVLRDPHEAQDAFQATFLVLVQRAGSIRRRESLGGWLYGVAGRVAAAARADEARRRAHERRLAERASTTVATRPDLAPAVREEVDRLPEPLRAPVVLCYLEGRTHDEAAGLLGLPVGTVRSRLARARSRLESRLIRLGLAPGLGAAALLAPADLPAALVASTLSAASRIAAGASPVAGVIPAAVAARIEGALRAMSLTALKRTAAAVLAVAALATGVAGLAQQPGQDDATAKPAKPVTSRSRSGPEAELKRLLRELSEAVLRRDAETADRLLDDRFVCTDPVGGLWDKESYLKEIEERAWGLTSLTNDEVEVRVFGAAAVITARVRWEVRYQGEESEGVDRSTFMFVRADGRWRCVADHGCRLAKKSNLDNPPTLPSAEDAPPPRAKAGRGGTRRPSPRPINPPPPRE